MSYGEELCEKIYAGRYATLDEMKECINSWITEYENRYYIRFAVLDVETKKAVGTVEIFENIRNEANITREEIKYGCVLHVDLAASYETKKYISELLVLAEQNFVKTFRFKYLLIRAVPEAAERVAALGAAGYVPFAWGRVRKYFYVKKVFE